MFSEIASGNKLELNPVCAIIGGLLSREILKVVSGKDEPVSNCVVYDGQGATVWNIAEIPKQKSAIQEEMIIDDLS